MRLKEEVQQFWNTASCGEVYAEGVSEAEYYESHERARYQLEPMIAPFAEFQQGRNKTVLEVGVGMGADHLQWAGASPKSLHGVDLTPRAAAHTQRRLSLYGLRSSVLVADAERLPYADESFDVVYSWGVIHHSPDTARAVEEIWRVLKRGGIARVMIYHRHSILGAMLWLRYGLAKLRPFRSLDDLYATHLESPGTKAYSRRTAERMFSPFSSIRIDTELGVGDLLEGAAGQRHSGPALRVMRLVWPRWFIRRACRKFGLALLITAVK